MSGPVDVLVRIKRAVLHGGLVFTSKARYENHFVALAADVPFRPARTTPKPTVPGVVTGIVEGVGDRVDLSHLDDQGRYRIRFLFDSAPAGERQASHPVRMAQPHAGPDYGMHFPLKPGIEVIMGFVNGDPDRPIVLGSVPNPVTRSPVDVGTKTLNRIKTESGVVIEIADERGS